jgi:predicted dehydrogenase
MRLSTRACITAIAARDPERGRRFAETHGIAGVEPSYDALLRRDDVDAVYIALPASLHAPWTLAAIEAKKHVLCEKPFAGNARDAARMVAAAREHHRVLVEALHYRFHPLVTRIRAIIAGGAIGRVAHVVAVFDAPIPDTSDIRHTLALGGGALMDLGCYPLHWARLAVGEEPQVARAESVGTGAPGVDLAMCAELLFPGGARADIRCSMGATYFAELRVTGTLGELSTRDLLAPTDGLSFEVQVSGPGGRHVERVAGGTSYAYQLEAFLAAVLDGCPAPTGGEDAIATMRLIDAVYEAAGLPPRP